MAEKRVTKKENFERIVEVLEAQGMEDLAEVMRHEIELVSKKRNGQTKAQKANAELVEKVFEVLAEAGKAMTATEVMNACAEAGVEGVTSNQKATALLKMLIEDKRVNKVVDGKKSTFVVAD